MLWVSFILLCLLSISIIYYDYDNEKLYRNYILYERDSRPRVEAPSWVPLPSVLLFDFRAMVFFHFAANLSIVPSGLYFSLKRSSSVTYGTETPRNIA